MATKKKKKKKAATRARITTDLRLERKARARRKAAG